MTTISDAVSLPGGGVLVALGDDGVELLEGPSGGARHRFACPAQSLSLSLDGRHAIAAPRRLSPQPFHWIDLTERRVEPWPLERVSSIARTFESPLLYVVGGAQGWVRALRVTTRDRQEIVAWHPQDVDWPGSVWLCGDRLYVECSSLGAFHYEVRELPSLDIVEVGDFKHPVITPEGGKPWFGMFPPVTSEIVYVMVEGKDARLCGRLDSPWRVPVPGQPVAFDASGPWVAVLLWVHDRCDLMCFRLGEHYPRLLHTFASPLVALDPAWLPASSARKPFQNDACGGIRIDFDRLVAWTPHDELVVADLDAQRVTLVSRFG